MDETDGRPVVETLNELLVIYREKLAYYQKSCKRVQLIYHILSLSSIILNITGTLVGTVNKNQIALGVLSGFGILLQSILKVCEYEKKIYYRKLAVSQYKQILNKIEAYIRTDGQNCSLSNFTTEINLIEDFISGVCPLLKHMAK